MMQNKATKTANNINSNLSCNCLYKRPENLSACPSIPRNRVIIHDVEILVTDSLLRE
jgi:hypothetical protein